MASEEERIAEDGVAGEALKTNQNNLYNILCGTNTAKNPDGLNSLIEAIIHASSDYNAMRIIASAYSSHHKEPQDVTFDEAAAVHRQLHAEFLDSGVEEGFSLSSFREFLAERHCTPWVRSRDNGRSPDFDVIIKGTSGIIRDKDGPSHFYVG